MKKRNDRDIHPEGIKIKKKKKIRAIPIAAAALVAAALLFHFRVWLKPAAARGVCGEHGANAIWSVDWDGTLTIGGFGKTRDYYRNDPGPFTENGDIRRVVIKGGITGFGANLFRGCENLTQIEFPNRMKSLGSRTFSGCESLESVALPEGIGDLGSFLFSDCVGLKSVSIPEGVTAIGMAAFSGCEGLSDVVLPESLVHIESLAFENCTGLKTIRIPAKVVSLFSYSDEDKPDLAKLAVEYGESAFLDCSSLAEFTVDENNQAFSALDGVLFNKNKTALIRYPEGKTGESYAVPDGIGRLAQSAFSNCESLKTISLPDGLNAIHGAAFFGCASLEEIALPETVQTIQWSAFDGCAGLRSVRLPAGVKTVDEGAFWGCENLTEITVAEGNGNYSATDGVLFNKNKTSLLCYPAGKPDRAYAIPETVKEIGGAAFYKVTALEALTVPDAVGELTAAVFCECPNLRALSVSDANPSYAAADGVLFNKEKTALICCPQGKPDAEYDVPEGTQTIADGAFEGCKMLSRISIPAETEEIETKFGGCDSLAEFTVDKNNNFFFTVDGVLYSRLPDLVRYPPAKPGETYTVPDNVKVTGIAEGAFEGSKNLVEITLPEGVYSVRYEAFSNCKKLERVTIPASVIEINSYLFTGSDRLTDVYFGSGKEALDRMLYSGWEYDLRERNITLHFGAPDD